MSASLCLTLHSIRSYPSPLPRAVYPHLNPSLPFLPAIARSQRDKIGEAAVLQELTSLGLPPSSASLILDCMRIDSLEALRGEKERGGRGEEGHNDWELE